ISFWLTKRKCQQSQAASAGPIICHRVLCHDSPKKTARPKTRVKRAELMEGLPDDASLSATAVEATTIPKSSEELQPPTQATEPREVTEDAAPRAAVAGTKTINISQLQAMSMAELNQMAKEMGIENFGTMKKHEVIFQILQKNAERSGILFAEGVLEILPEGFGFLRSQSVNYLPCPEDRSEEH